MGRQITIKQHNNLFACILYVLESKHTLAAVALSAPYASPPNARFLQYAVSTDLTHSQHNLFPAPLRSFDILAPYKLAYYYYYYYYY